MSQAHRSLARLLQEDQRYTLEAYRFVSEALNYAQEVLGMGTPDESPAKAEAQEPHLSGQQLCEAAVIYALEQYGYMARVVLNNIGIRSTSDIGEIVYNLIRIKQMKKSKRDRREDFDDVFDFDQALQQGFKITMPE
jgi:uncharacterized repeat protein (TIGR04138 family)